MAQCKAHQVDQFLARPDPAYRTILIYGPDHGLVSERAKDFAKATKVDLADPFSTISLDADEVAADPLKLADEAHTISMFGGNRLIWIRGNTQKNFANAVKPVLETSPQDAWILIEAGDLKKSSALRNAVEKSSSGIALPCYQDNDAALNRLIDEVLADHSLSIGPDARERLKQLLGGDRLASRGELEKLALYCSGADDDRKEVSIADIEAIVGDASMTLLDEVLDAVSLGNVAGMERAVGRLYGSGTTASTLLIVLLNHFHNLHRARAMVEQKRSSVASAVQSMRPPVSFTRKGAISQSLQIWTLASLERVMDRLNEANRTARLSTELAESLAGTAMLAIALEARRGRR